MKIYKIILIGIISGIIIGIITIDHIESNIKIKDNDQIQIQLGNKKYKVIYNGYSRGVKIRFKELKRIVKSFYKECNIIFQLHNSDIKEIYVNIQPPFDYKRKIDRYKKYGWKYQIRIAIDIKTDYKTLLKKDLHKNKITNKEELWFSYYMGYGNNQGGIIPLYKENAQLCQLSFNKKNGAFKQEPKDINLNFLKKVDPNGVFYEYTNKPYPKEGIFNYITK